MNTRERFKAIMNFEPVDRLPMIESYWWWDKTLERWYEEGLPRDLKSHDEIAAYHGLDPHIIFWIAPTHKAIRPEGRPRSEGIIDNEDDYNERVNHIYDDPVLNPEAFRNIAEQQSRGEIFVWMQLNGFFWHPREIFGIENHLLAFYDQPALMHRINAQQADYNLRVIEDICKVCTPDIMTFAEDMSYNHGPMLSKECFDEFLAPYYRKVVPKLKERGIIPFVDSDGDVNELIVWLQEVGIEGLSPLERMAGTDINAIRQKHPHFKMLGAFDKTVMHLGKDAIREEFERILPVMKSGGYIPSVDHQTPPEVSLRDYQTYVTILREYCLRACQ